MPIESINILIKLKCQNNEIAQIICSSIEPDNLTTSPMEINSVCKNEIILFSIKNIRGVSPPATALATVKDLLTAYQLADNIIRQSVDNF